MDNEACKKYGIPLGALRQIEYELSDYIKRPSPHDTEAEYQSEPTTPVEEIDIKKIGVESGLSDDEIDKLIENVYLKYI